MRLEGIPDHPQFGGCGDEQALLQERKLGGIDRQQGEAGVELLPAGVVGVENQRLQTGIRLATITIEFPDKGRDIGDAGSTE